MKTTRIKNLLTGEILTMVKLSKLVDTDEYNRLLGGETIHKWENTKKGLTEIKLSAI